MRDGIAGGALYHWRAFRHANSQWTPFKTALGEWMEESRILAVPRPRLLVIGGSAGYCFLGPWAANFSDVLWVDPDPWVPFIVRRRFAHVVGKLPELGLHFDSSALLEPTCARLDALLTTRSPRDTWIVLPNVLGQLFLLPEFSGQSMSAYWAKLTERLEGWGVLAYYDRLSGKVPPTRLPEGGERVVQSLTPEELVERFYPTDRKGELQDHHTAGLFPQAHERALFEWRLLPGRSHLIEGFRYEPRAHA